MKLIKKTLLFCILLTYYSITAQVNLASSLTACYNLDGHAVDAINSLNGTLSAVSAIPDRMNIPNSALDFSGTTSSMVRLPNSPLIKPSPAISVSGWFKVTQFVQHSLIVFAVNSFQSYHTSYALAGQNSGNGYTFAVWRQDGSGSDYVEGTTIVSLNTWYHVAFTIDNSVMRIYINGQLENTMATTISNFNYSTSKGVILGGSDESYNVPFIGGIDNLRFYSRIINSAEVNALYVQDSPCTDGPVTGIQDLENIEVSLSPNPTKGLINIGGVSETAHVVVLDLAGKVMPFVTQKNEGNLQVDIGSFSSGLYFLKVGSENNEKVFKIVKE